MTLDGRLRLGFVGIHAGPRRDRPISQNEILAAALAGEGHIVRTASALRPPSFRTAHQLAAIARWRRSVDVIVIAVFSGPSFFMAELAAAAAGLEGIPVVLVLHGGRLPEFAARHPRRVGRLLRQASAITSPSRFLAGALDRFGRTIEVIPNLVALDALPTRTRRAPAPRLLWMRTLHPLYDPLTAIDAFDRVRARHPEARLTIAGADRGLRADVEAEVARRGLHGAVTIPGYLDGEAKQRAFDEHDLFLNTNLIDNTPVSVLEACAAGLLVVATRVGGIPDLLTDGTDALLVEAGDGAAMADAVDALLCDPERCVRMSEAAQALARRSSWPVVRPRWEAMLSSVARGG